MNLAPLTSGEQLPVSTSISYRRAGLPRLLGLSKASGWLLCREPSTGPAKGKAASCSKTHIPVLLQQTVAHHSLTVYTRTRIIRAITVN